MKKHFLAAALLCTQLLSFAQDTTWVQTLTFDSISTRRGLYTFPASLNSKRFEKVLMYYKLKCSPLTPWDSYDCGEWDYLTYSRIFEHTGIYDSTQVLGNQFEANFATPNNITFEQYPNTLADTYVRQEKNRSGASLTTNNINTANAISQYPFNLTKAGGRFQVLLTAAELQAAGIVAGNIQSLRFYMNSFLLNGDLQYPTVSLKATTAAELTKLEAGGFTEVYNASHWSGGSQPTLSSGGTELLFYQPFAWNGTDNLIVEFYLENTLNLNTGNNVLFDAESISTNTAVAYEGLNGAMQFSGSNKALSRLSDFTVGNEMTIAFWAKGTGSAGTNTSILEAYDTLNNRIINIHMPWSDNNMYFDVGASSAYDRISKAMNVSTEADNVWNHWAFVKNATTGDMKIYKNGTQWHSGTGKTIPIGYVHRLVLGTNMNASYNWKGKIDEFQFYDKAMTQADIQAWMNKKPDNTHPNWNNLLVYYDFDDKKWAEDLSQNNNTLMTSEKGMFDFTELPLVNHIQQNKRPVLGFGQGTVSGAMQITEHAQKVVKEPVVVFEFTPVNRHFEIVNYRVGVEAGTEDVYNIAGQVISQTPFTGSSTMTNGTLSYYQKPVERLNDIEIGRYITPYGIGFDLGASGFNYIYDVTDYQQYLKNLVDLEAHNTQELIDLRFAFIEGTPPRDVHSRKPIWSEWRSYQYSDMDADNVLSAVDVQLADTSEMFKIKTRFSGHGQVGSGACCEWTPKTHEILVNGVSRFDWEIWQYSECGDNPNIAQGGTWPYAREGWCPGDMVKEHDYDLTPYVTPGTTVSLDYDIENIPSDDIGQGAGNYIVAMDLISYSAPNFQHDAAVVDVLNPNNYEYYKKFNPTCSYPRILLQNTGAQDLTQCTIRIWITPDKPLDYSWTGNLKFLEKEVVEIPITDLYWWYSMTGSHTFTAQVISVESAAFPDEYAHNNTFTTKFQSPEIVNGKFFVWFTTNNKAAENKYKLIKDNGELVFERTTLANATQYKDTFDLAPGCYSIILEDSDHDGINFWYSQQTEGETIGSFRLRYPGGSVFETFPGDFGHYHRYNFSVGLENLAVEELDPNANLSIYPNPGEGQFYVDLGGVLNNEAKLSVCDLQGRIVWEQEMNVSQNHADSNLNLSHVPAGMYVVKVVSGAAVYTKELIKQ